MFGRRQPSEHWQGSLPTLGKHWFNYVRDIMKSSTLPTLAQCCIGSVFRNRHWLNISLKTKYDLYGPFKSASLGKNMALNRPFMIT